MAIFYFINWIAAAETIQGGKLFKGGNYSRKETIRRNTANFLYFSDKKAALYKILAH